MQNRYLEKIAADTEPSNMDVTKQSLKTWGKAMAGDVPVGLGSGWLVDKAADKLGIAVKEIPAGTKWSGMLGRKAANAIKGNLGSIGATLGGAAATYAAIHHDTKKLLQKQAEESKSRSRFITAGVSGAGGIGAYTVGKSLDRYTHQLAGEIAREQGRRGLTSKKPKLAELAREQFQRTKGLKNAAVASKVLAGALALTSGVSTIQGMTNS